MLLRVSSIAALLFALSVHAQTDDSCNRIYGAGEHKILSQGLLDDPTYSLEGRRMTSVSVALDDKSHSSLVIHNPKTRTEKYIDPYSAHAYPGVDVQVSADGKFATFAPPSKYVAHPVVYSVDADRSFHLKAFARAKQVQLLKGSRYLIARLLDNRLGVYDLQTQTTRIDKIFEDGWDFVELGQSNRILLNSENGFMRVVDLDTLHSDKVELEARVSDAQSSADGNKILLYNKFDRKNETAFLYDVVQRTHIEFKLIEPTQVQLLPDGSGLTYVRKSQPQGLRLVTPGEDILLEPDYGMGIAASDDGSTLLFRRKDGKLVQYDRVSGKRMLVPLPDGAEVYEFSFMAAGTGEVAIQYSHQGRYYYSIQTLDSPPAHPYEVPYNAQTHLSPDRKSAMLFFPDPAYFKGGSVVYYDLATVSAQTAGGKLPRSNLAKAYEALGHPGAIRLKEHTGLVLQFFESGQFKRNKRLAQKILLNVLDESIGLYESIVDRYPEFTPEGGFFREEIPDEVPARWKHALIRYLDYFAVARAHGGSIVESVKYVRPLHNAIYALSDTQLAYYADALTEAMKDAAQVEYPGIFKSMLYKFCEQYLYPIFWIPYHNVTDLPLIRSAYRVEPVILGSEAISGDVSTKTPYGFYAKRLPVIHIDRDAKVGDVIVDEKVQWSQGKDQYSVDLKLTVKAESIDDATPVLRRFAMSQYTEDGVLSGTIVIGSNLHAEDKSTIDGYVRFFKKLGYKFEDPKYTRNLKEYFKDKVINGEMDYFIKEAHSDGDEKNVFRINVRDRILVASRKLANGKRQTIHIVIPSGKPVEDYSDLTRTVLISNEEMGEWIRLRKANGHPPLIKFNTSCWSVSKMRQEIEAANSDGEIDIASTEPVSMFEYDRNNAEYILLTDFFAGRLFKTTRKKMRAYNADHAHGTGNTFIYPDDIEFDLYVRDVLKPVLNIQAPSLKNGQPYSIDE